MVNEFDSTPAGNAYSRFPGLPVRPKGLKPQARKLWDYITPKLHEIGTATEIDAPALTALVQWWATYLEAQKALEKIQDWTTTEAQRVLTATSKAYENFRRLSLEFGLTPKARNQIDVKPTEKDELERLFA